MPKEIRFNAFEMNCVAHQSPGLWRHPRDRSRDYKRLSYWTELAQILERGLFDGCSSPTCWASTTSSVATHARL
jgi:long-chain alkane monooxygenase